MPPKALRSSSGQLRTHSRSSSSTKLGANLQLTQKDQPHKHTEKAKRAAYDPHLKASASAQRVHSSQTLSKRPQAHEQPASNATKTKSGFTIANTADDDDDEWVSSESGAATPAAQHDSDSDTASEGEHPRSVLKQPAEVEPPRAQTPIPRVDTARPPPIDTTGITNRFSAMQLSSHTPAAAPSNFNEQSKPETSQQHSSEHDSHKEEASRQYPGNKRYSVTRPPSTHSISSRGDHIMRPHPLIRGQSYGQVGKPPPLSPLTVIPKAPPPQISESPPDSTHNLSTSPSSLRTSTASMHVEPTPSHRRTSFSSARSAATTPSHSSFLRDSAGPIDRARTISAMSNNSAALSSLTNLPSVTRPPSPLMISFFPPVNPYANIEAIHPLLPTPYINNHLTVLTRRTPIRESFDRVIRAKQAAR